jgi:hypothetical protein
MENVEICRKPGFFSPESQFPSINNVTVDSIALGLKKNPSNTTMVIKAKNIVVAIVTFTNLSDAMSAGEVVLDRNCFLNFICFLIRMMDATLKAL